MNENVGTALALSLGMRAYAKVTAGHAVVYIPATSNRIDMEVEAFAPRKADGWYRVKATCDEGWGGWVTEIGAKINPEKEAVRLLALAKKGEDKQARTDKPGVVGYLHMERMSTAAIQNQVEVSKYFAKMLSASGRRNS